MVKGNTIDNEENMYRLMKNNCENINERTN